MVFTLDTGAYDPEAVEKERGRLGALSQSAAAGFEKSMQGSRSVADDTAAALEAAATSMKEAREGRWNLPLLAMSAGMLNTTPGVASNFGNEMGRGLSAMVPAIQQKRMSDQSFYEKIAELQALRGKVLQGPQAAEAEHQAKRQLEADKELSALEIAALKSVPIHERTRAKHADQLASMENDARNDVKAAYVGLEALKPEQFAALVKERMAARIAMHNSQPGMTKIEAPQLTPEEERIATDARNNVQKKNLDEDQAKRFAAIQAAVSKDLSAKYPAFSSLDPDQQELLRQDLITQRIEDNNRRTKEGSETWIPPVTPTRESAEALMVARNAHGRMVNFGEPTKEEVEKDNLPVENMPSTYKGLSYKEKQSVMRDQLTSTEKHLEKIRAQAEELASKTKMADRFMQEYDRTDRTGWSGGWLGAIGSDSAQEVDRISSTLNLMNVPTGQGAVSDTERKIMGKANPSRGMERGAAVTITSFYKEAAIRANDQLLFMETWKNKFRTIDGAMSAWNEYINSPQGTILKEGSGGSMEINPRRMGWREYFDRKNKGELNAKKKVWNPETGKIEEQ